ncbi:MAG: citrate lyase ligase [Anaerosporomusa subterranea]|jgi:[citrate (pro-3S)-lyase] ligase|nr:citrate lyase ligase [Anaerosporomusa subterranea]
MFNDVKIEIVNLTNTRQFREVQDFLAQFDLAFDADVEYTVLARLAEKMVGTGSFKGEILRNIAIDENLQGLGLTATIVSALMQEQSHRGRMHYFVFTKPSKAHLFANLGFTEIVRAEPYVALLETGLGSIEGYCKEVEIAAAHLPGERAAIVVNCNPFTKGHQALIEKAAGENAAVIVFVVSEECSLFPFADRLKLVKAGAAHLPNVAVVPAGNYIISAATFPTYFTRDEDAVVAQTRLDITLFATQIARRLHINRRYMGQEPYCQVTNAYNQAMLDILPAHGISVKVMERIQVAGEIVSASKVREMIKRDDWEGIQRLVPETTYDYLVSDETKPILAKIRSTDSRH